MNNLVANMNLSTWTTEVGVAAEKSSVDRGADNYSGLDTGVDARDWSGLGSAPRLDAGDATQGNLDRITRPVTTETSGHRCPSCRSIVYSRRHRLCGVCSQPLPEQLLFSVSEAKRIKALMQFERARHRKWLAESFEVSASLL
jgi:hypothetical protein